MIEKTKNTACNTYPVVPLVFIDTSSKRKITFVGKGGHERDVQSPSFGSTSAMEKKLMHKDLNMIANCSAMRLKHGCKSKHPNMLDQDPILLGRKNHASTQQNLQGTPRFSNHRVSR